MERFIESQLQPEMASFYYLKSSMERFIVCTDLLYNITISHLKSSMERFIEEVTANLVPVDFKFKIQYGEIYRYQEKL